MQALLVSFGSMGDTLPFVALGKALKERGHDVTLIANGYFRSLIEREGLGFTELLTADAYDQFLQNQQTWTTNQALKGMGDLVIADIEKLYRLVEERYVPGETVVCSQGYGFGARIANEKLGVPLATVHLQPMWFRSIYDPPGLADWIPRWLPRGIDRIIDFFVDRRLGTAVNEFRSTLGLPRAKRVMKNWWNSPQLVMGLFPDWFNQPQPDWPAQTYLPGFPLLTVGSENFDSTEIDAFLDAGDPPLVFSQSSVTLNARQFFERSIEIARRLNRRAVLLNPHPDQIPQPLPDTVRYFRYIPLEKILPRSLAHIHHGGIGTIAHTLAAGIPQVTVPWVYDQPDNSQRLQRLGVSEFVWPRAYRVEPLVSKLQRLLDSPEVAEKCRVYRERCLHTDALGNACQALEQLWEASRPAPARMA